ncbi:cell wall hydrolase [Rhizobium miluonense]|uniref:Spore germination cell wall hydrolase CwlJ-like protein n=1 Tax=Rhizobium miluonense TaxID=411945 RepID=A0ABU1SL64_9HYPH|nr:cell wall hydrolase [Rhizobium miluonense]MDR6899082.1 spore germination cell wall hydrolase CwlJ-like protein [Rhizobium miluonense]
MSRSRYVSRKSRFLPQNWTSPAVFGLCAWLIFPSAAAYGDLAGLLAGIDREGANWRMVMTDSPAGSTHQAELAFGDAKASFAVGDGGLILPDGRRVAFQSEAKGSDPRPDEDRINRQDKKGRVVAITPMLPPKDFSAGSVLQRQSLLLRPESATGERTAFLKPNLGGKEIQIATAFYKKEPPKPDESVPAYIANLVTNQNADVLAAAYASPAPDYARVSPFDSILAKDQDDEGRFVPQIGPKDHAWAANVLPPSVFSSDEQQCLATGIYFEARGESVKGQAAVAQVILNRVRNPAYPKTICGVVYQNEDWTNACQFSFACDNVKERVNSPEHWRIARQVAMAVTAGKIWLPEVGSATHYHAVYVRPKWAAEMVKVGRIGMHIFYRTYGGGWS